MKPMRSTPCGGGRVRGSLSWSAAHRAWLRQSPALPPERPAPPKLLGPCLWPPAFRLPARIPCSSAAESPGRPGHTCPATGRERGGGEVSGAPAAQGTAGAAVRHDCCQGAPPCEGSRVGGAARGPHGGADVDGGHGGPPVGAVVQARGGAHVVAGRAARGAVGRDVEVQVRLLAGLAWRGQGEEGGRMSPWGRPQGRPAHCRLLRPCAAAPAKLSVVLVLGRTCAGLIVARPHRCCAGRAVDEKSGTQRVVIACSARPCTRAAASSSSALKESGATASMACWRSDRKRRLLGGSGGAPGKFGGKGGGGGDGGIGLYGRHTTSARSGAAGDLACKGNMKTFLVRSCWLGSWGSSTLDAPQQRPTCTNSFSFVYAAPTAPFSSTSAFGDSESVF
jgi:hypothetical protein